MKTRKFLILVLIVIVSVIWTILVNRAMDQIPDSAPPVVQQEVELAANPVILMDAKVLGRRIARNFREGELRNSRGITLPPRIRRLIANKADTPREKERTWYRKTLNYAACVNNAFTVPETAPLGWLCVTKKQWNNDTHYEVWNKVTRVKLSCGGAAAFGYYGGGWIGVGLAGGSCMWATMVELND